MSPQDVIKILRNYVTSLQSQREVSVNSGDLDRVAKIDADITSTEATISVIENSLQG